MHTLAHAVALSPPRRDLGHRPQEPTYKLLQTRSCGCRGVVTPPQRKWGPPPTPTHTRVPLYPLGDLAWAGDAGVWGRVSQRHLPLSRDRRNGVRTGQGAARVAVAECGSSSRGDPDLALLSGEAGARYLAGSGLGCR